MSSTYFINFENVKFVEEKNGSKLDQTKVMFLLYNIT